MAELFLTGVLDKAGHINLSLPTCRVRQGAHGAEYVVAWADETQEGREIAIDRGGYRQPAAGQGSHLCRVRGSGGASGSEPGGGRTRC